MIPPEYLFRLRTAVARHGEQDVANWWPTQGLLGPQGATLYARSFPRTHPFARARVVSEAAKARTCELYAVKDVLTLWTLPTDLEDRLELARQEWLRDPEPWGDFFEALEAHKEGELSVLLQKLDLVSASALEEASQLSRPTSGPAMEIPGHEVKETTFALLAAAHGLGSRGNPVVPHLGRRH